MCLINYSLAYTSAHARTTAANDSKHMKGQSGVIFFALRIISLRGFELFRKKDSDTTPLISTLPVSHYTRNN